MEILPIVLSPILPHGSRIVADYDEEENRVCSCGHRHLGVYYRCAQCLQTFCPKCFVHCSQFFRDMLKVTVNEPMSDGGKNWVNTCKDCKETSSVCEVSCIGRRSKWSLVWSHTKLGLLVMRNPENLGPLFLQPASAPDSMLGHLVLASVDAVDHGDEGNEDVYDVDDTDTFHVTVLPV